MENIDAYIQRAELLLAQGRPKDAEKQLAQALSQDPENDHALCLLGRCKYDQKEFTEGMRLIRNAVRIDPSEDYYLYLLGFGAYHLNHHAEAIKYVHQACSLNPYAAPYFGLWALILLDETKFEEALNKANEGLALDPGELTCLNARSTALNKLKRTDDAIATMQDALEQDPENEYTHTTIGWNLLEKGRAKDARKHFREALRINPNLDAARTGLKESLKSRLLPYKWLLQYSFWINNQGQQARWIIPIGLYVIVRLFGAAAKTGGENMKLAGIIVASIYLVFVMATWVMNPLANLVLLCDKNGKYALTRSEIYNALLFGAAVVSGILLLAASSLYDDEEQSANLLLAGCVAVSMAVPLGHMEFPLRTKANPPAQWLAMLLLILGPVAIAVGILNMEYAAGFFLAYGIAFVPFMWISAFSKK